MSLSKLHNSKPISALFLALATGVFAALLLIAATNANAASSVTNTLVSHPTLNVKPTADGSSGHPSVSADGRYVAYQSGATNLVQGDTNGLTDIFLSDTKTGETRRISVATDNSQADGGSYSPSISADGRYVAYHSLAKNLVAADSNGLSDIFLSDIKTGETQRINLRKNGQTYDEANGPSTDASVSADGNYVVFQSDATNLVGDTNAVSDIFFVNTRTRDTYRISVRKNADGTYTEANKESFNPAISADGSHIAYESQATNLVDNDTNKRQDIFSFNSQTGKTDLVSVSKNPVGTLEQLGSHSYSPSISSDGRYIAYDTASWWLENQNRNMVSNVILFDTQTGNESRVSGLKTSGRRLDANGSSSSASVSADGHYVTYDSAASNLSSAGDTNGHTDIYRYNNQTGDNERISLGANGTQANDKSRFASISGDGSRVAYVTSATNLISDADSNTFDDVLLYGPADVPTPGTPVTPTTNNPTPGGGSTSGGGTKPGGGTTQGGTPPVPFGFRVKAVNRLKNAAKTGKLRLRISANKPAALKLGLRMKIKGKRSRSLGNVSRLQLRNAKPVLFTLKLSKATRKKFRIAKTRKNLVLQVEGKSTASPAQASSLEYVFDSKNRTRLSIPKR